MKLLLLLTLWISIMAQEKVPYPYPNYDSDLMAKELINGTYYASIQMSIRNSKTGEERYVHVPDSPMIEKMQQSEQVAQVNTPDIDSNMSLYDRDKMLEDAVLPKYVDVPENEPTIVSRAMCPQGLEFVKIDKAYNLDQVHNLDGYTRYDDGTTRTLVLEIDNTIYRYDGLVLVKMFDMPSIPHPLDNTREIQLYFTSFHRIDNKHFIFTGGYLFEYTLNSHEEPTRLRKEDTINGKGVIVKEKGTYYFIGGKGREVTIFDFYADIDNTTLESEILFNEDSYRSIVDSSFFINGARLFQLKDGNIIFHGRVEEVGHKKEFATMVSRFDYNRIYGAPININLRKGIPTPYINKNLETSEKETFMGITTVAVVRDKDGILRATNHIAYSQDYVNVIDTGVEAYRLLTFNDKYAYFASHEGIVIMKITGWSYKIPRAEYAEQFAREGMLDAIWWRNHDKPNIGD